MIHRQERRILSNNSMLNAATRTSVSSWDFTVELPHTPTAPKRTAAGSSHSTHLGLSVTHLSQHSSSNPSSPNRMKALEENAYADAFAQALAAKPRRPRHDVYSDADRDDDDQSSASSSAVDLSDATTPEFAPSSSAATTPLSCSPANALETSSEPKLVPPVPPLSLKREGQASSPNSAISGSQPSRPINEKKKLPEEAQKGWTHRRGSSPSTSATHPNLSILRRTGSATFNSISALQNLASPGTNGEPSASPPVSSPLNSTPPSGATTPKESKWKKLIRTGTGNKVSVPEDPPVSPGMPPSATQVPTVATPGALKDGSRRKSTLGRILEKTGR